MSNSKLPGLTISRPPGYSTFKEAMEAGADDEAAETPIFDTPVDPASEALTRKDAFVLPYTGTIEDPRDKVGPTSGPVFSEKIIPQVKGKRKSTSNPVKTGELGVGDRLSWLKGGQKGTTRPAERRGRKKRRTRKKRSASRRSSTRRARARTRTSRSLARTRRTRSLARTRSLTRTRRTRSLPRRS
jgi:hypothetical protein